MVQHWLNQINTILAGDFLTTFSPFCVFQPLWSSGCCHCTAVWCDQSHWHWFPPGQRQRCCPLQQDLGGPQMCIPNGMGQSPKRKCHCGKGKGREMTKELPHFIKLSSSRTPDWINVSPHYVLNIRRVAEFSSSSTNLFYLCSYKNMNILNGLTWIEW